MLSSSLAERGIYVGEIVMMMKTPFFLTSAQPIKERSLGTCASLCHCIISLDKSFHNVLVMYMFD